MTYRIKNSVFVSLIMYVIVHVLDPRLCDLMQDALKSYYGMRSWFDPRRGGFFMPMYEIGPNQHRAAVIPV